MNAGHDSTVVQRFRDDLQREFRRRFPRSLAASASAEGVLLDGTSHRLRGNDPFMPVARSARGAHFEDLDGHRYVDYWQGHYANVFGHNPGFLLAVVEETARGGAGLQSGLIHAAEAEVAELLCARTGQEAVRLTTSGTLAAFFATLLARAFTGRSLVVKMAGGWHGGQPFGLKGVAPDRSGAFDAIDTEGLPRAFAEDIRVTRFNDTGALSDLLSDHGDEVACVIVEPLLGAGGAIAASREFLEEARAATRRCGALLIADEVITGFRFRAGDACALYGVRPDLLVLGKVIGGGMPVAAVAGRSDVLALAAGPRRRVRFDGGTFAAHDLSLRVARRALEELIRDEDRIYPALARKGQALRGMLQALFVREELPLRVVGSLPADVGGSSLIMVHPVKEGTAAPTCPEETAGPRHHPRLDESLLKATCLLEGLSVSHGLGAISLAHSSDDLSATVEKYLRVARRLREGAILP